MIEGCSIRRVVLTCKRTCAYRRSSCASGTGSVSEPCRRVTPPPGRVVSGKVQGAAVSRCQKQEPLNGFPAAKTVAVPPQPKRSCLGTPVDRLGAELPVMREARRGYRSCANARLSA